MDANVTRISRYYTVSDGTRLAVDLYLPEGDVKRPAIMHSGRGNRRNLYAGHEKFIGRLLENGYAVVIPELRGNGASFGRSDGFHDRQDARDIKELMELMAAEDWSDGQFAMFGGSNMGFIQDLAAAERPAPLKAVIPTDDHPDFYYQDYPNGASRHIAMPPGAARQPRPAEPRSEPVDDDADGSLLEAAIADHASNLGFLEQYFPNMHRDTVNPKLGCAPQSVIPIWDRMDSIAYSGIRYYKNGAWYDPGATGAIFAYKEFDGKLLIGPWRHCEIFRCDLPAPKEPNPFMPVMDAPNGAFPWQDEYIRFFNAVLRGEENGCFDEPPVRYYTCGEEDGKERKYAADLPVDSQVNSYLYLSGEPSGTISSRFDGSLSEQPAGESRVDYTVEKGITLYGPGGTMNRNLKNSFMHEAEKCMTFTGAPLEHPVELTGVPVLELDATSTHPDGLFFAVLEEVYPDGNTCFLSEGAMRASHAPLGFHRAYASLGLPYHPGLSTNLAKLEPEKPLRLAFIMEALSHLIHRGSRLRLSIFCDQKGYQQPEEVGEDTPKVSLHLGSACLKLPVVEPDVTEFSGEISVAGGAALPGRVFVFKRAIFTEISGRWTRYDCRQVYPAGENVRVYDADGFTVTKTVRGGTVTVSAEGGVSFEMSGALPERGTFASSRPGIHQYRGFRARGSKYPVDIADRWVATVPVQKCQEGFPNIAPYHTMDLYLNIKHPHTGSAPYPCIVGIHGHGGDYDNFDALADKLLDAGFAVASVDYRATPPSRWPTLLHDVNGAIRHLKANAASYKLDPERFGIIGGSCGGHLSAFIAAVNGDPAWEGNVGGNTGFRSNIKAAAIYYPWTDAFGFGEDSYHQYPGQMNRVMNSDGPFAPPGYMIDFGGAGKGMAALKEHRFEPEYADAVRRAIDVSPVSHVTESSAPSAIVHGIFECGIQIPMNQSVRFFEALTRKGVKSLLLCNNNCVFGEDPEVQDAVVNFLKNRV